MSVATLVNTGVPYSSFDAALAAARGLPDLADIRIDAQQISGGAISGSYPGGLLVRAAPDVAASGVWGDGVEVVPSNGYVTDVAASGPVEVSGLFSGSQLGTYSTAVFRIGTYDKDIDFTCRDSVLGHQASLAAKVVFDCRDYSRPQRILIENCVIHTSVGLYQFSSLGMDVELVLKSCTLIDCNWRGSAAGAVNTDTPKLKLVDCYIHSALGPALEGLGFAELTNVATSDDTAYGPGALVNIPPEQVVRDRAARDFRQRDDSPLLGLGVDGGNIGASLGMPPSVPDQSVVVPSLPRLRAIGSGNLLPVGAVTTPVSSFSRLRSFGGALLSPDAAAVVLPPLDRSRALLSVGLEASGSVNSAVLSFGRSRSFGAMSLSPGTAVAVLLPLDRSRELLSIGLEAGGSVNSAVLPFGRSRSFGSALLLASGTSVVVPSQRRVRSLGLSGVVAQGSAGVSVAGLSRQRSAGLVDADFVGPGASLSVFFAMRSRSFGGAGLQAAGFAQTVAGFLSRLRSYGEIQAGAGSADLLVPSLRRSSHFGVLEVAARDSVDAHAASLSRSRAVSRVFLVVAGEVSSSALLHGYRLAARWKAPRLGALWVGDHED